METLPPPQKQTGLIGHGIFIPERRTGDVVMRDFRSLVRIILRRCRRTDWRGHRCSIIRFPFRFSFSPPLTARPVSSVVISVRQSVQAVVLHAVWACGVTPSSKRARDLYLGPHCRPGIQRISLSFMLRSTLC